MSTHKINYTFTLFTEDDEHYIELKVSFDYQPFELAERYYPGAAEEARIYNIESDNPRFNEDMLDKNELDKIEYECLKSMNDGFN